MTAAVSPVLVPLYDEGMRFWRELISECKDQVLAINSALSHHGQAVDEQVAYLADEDLHLHRLQYPSTTVKVNIRFERWGPVLKVMITGLQTPDFGFFPKELEVPLATEGDGCLVAVFDEGRSLTHRELASYLTQQFRRCFPRITLPCSNLAFA